MIEANAKDLSRLFRIDDDSSSQESKLDDEPFKLLLKSKESKSRDWKWEYEVLEDVDQWSELKDRENTTQVNEDEDMDDSEDD